MKKERITIGNKTITLETIPVTLMLERTVDVDKTKTWDTCIKLFESDGLYMVLVESYDTGTENSRAFQSLDEAMRYIEMFGVEVPETDEDDSDDDYDDGDMD